ncbi:MAG: bifunctional 4-hydroxy-3-methylbut-2-enyl diphosphate reductase/30S ribosomal protein S1 [Bacillota bacterium]
MLKVILARGAGFCFGVTRAVALAKESAQGKDRKVYTLGPLIHNPQVVAELEKEGVEKIEQLAQAPPGATIIIPAHGVGPDVLALIKERGYSFVDATCPFVRKAQGLAGDLSARGYQVVIVGDREHPEVKGIMGCTKGRAVVVEGPGEAESLSCMPKVAVLAQTTQPLANFQAVVDVLQKKAGNLEVYNTICHATSLRQEAVLKLAREVEAMVVVGGANSANTRRLAELSREAGTPAYQVETAGELNPAWFAGVRVAGLTAGASTPHWIVEEVQRQMKELGEVTEAQGTMAEEKETAATGITEGARESLAGVPEEAGAPQEAGAPEEAGAAPEEAVALEEANAPEDLETGAEPEKTPGPEQTSAPEKSSEEQMKEAVEVRALRPGQVVKGVVVQVNDDEVLVDVGAKSEGVVPLRELSAFEITSPQEIVQVGDEIEVVVVKVEDNEGRLLLSKARADIRKAWVELQEHMENGEPVEGIVREVVKGGLLVDVGLRAFLPASLVEKSYVEDLNAYLGRTVKAKVIELNRSKRKAILSRKAVLEEELVRQRKEVFAGLQEGQVVKGVVRRLTSFGAFVDIGGVDGLLHISEMAWYRINHPSDVLKVGDEIEVMVLRVDPENEKISLGLKQVLPNPWDQVEEKYPVGSIVKARVVRLASFGAFVQLEPGVEGLVHISHLADYHVGTPDEVVQEGEEIAVKVLHVDPAEKRIRLSMREANYEARKQRNQKPRSKENNGNVTIGEVVGDILEETKSNL